MLDLMADTDPRLDTCRQNIRVAIAVRETNFADVARKAGLSRNAVSQFVSGRTSLSYANMLKVCDVLNIPIGLLHRPDAITKNRIRLYTILERLPDHLTHKAFQAATEAVREAGGVLDNDEE